ncbi:endonuclease domain-containing protein [Dongia sp.]|uniref:endonuclease domain-containing protein n=1 Tax=Dongia sp. TaxID=1977262 RepID=UPI0037508677
MRQDKPFQIRTGPATREAARRLRKNMTEAEKRLWYRIRRRQLSEHQFRKQVELKSYIADFCCLKERLVIELDGGQHAEITEYELKRRAWLEANGYRVLRFWNNAVFDNIDGVLETIVRAPKAPKIEL